jgi:hypothetical protein
MWVEPSIPTRAKERRLNWRPMPPFPPEPSLPEAQHSATVVPMRYEDVTQDGRPTLLSLPHAIGEAVWRKLLIDHPISRVLSKAGVVPVLTRMILEGGTPDGDGGATDGGPISVRGPMTARGSYQLAHTVDDDGRPNRLLLRTFVTLEAPRARTYGPPPEGAGQPVVVGRCLGENTFTRLFAPPDQRKVVRFDGVEALGLPPVPPDRVSWTPPEELLAPPAGARLLDDAPAVDEAPIVFGLTHTDSNQHVNSLVYPRLFEDAALRRAAAHGLATAGLLARSLEIGYRKPCFAGDRMRIRLRAFVDERGRPGAAGCFVPEGAGEAARPHAFVRLSF